MPSKMIFYIIIAIIIGGAIYFINLPKDGPLIDNNNITNQQPNNITEDANNNSADQNVSADGDNLVNNNNSTPDNSNNQTPPPILSSTKTFTITGTPFSFSIKEMRVKKGDTVKVIFTNASGFHDWVIDQFNTRTPQINAGQTATIEFVASQTGTFEYYCSVGNHRAQGMRGNLIVE